MSIKGKLSYKFIKNKDQIMIVCSKKNQFCSNIASVYYQGKRSIKDVIIQDIGWIIRVVNYTWLMIFDYPADKKRNIFLPKLAKMNYSVFINCASLFINSTFVDGK